MNDICDKYYYDVLYIRQALILGMIYLKYYYIKLLYTIHVKTILKMRHILDTYYFYE